MSIQGVPLTVRLGDKHITKEVSGVSFKETQNGVQSIDLRLARPLSKFDPDLQGFSSVYLYDARSAETVAQGKISDTGRAVDTSAGQVWEVVAFGPVQALRDETFPYIVVDTRQDTFIRSTYCTRNATTGSEEIDEDTPALFISADEGKTITTSWMGDMINRVARRAGMKLARVRVNVDSGQTNANFTLALVTRAGTGGGTTAASATANTAGATLAGVVVTDFTNGHDVCSIRVTRSTSTTTGLDTTYYQFYQVRLRTLLLDQDGAEITTGYTLNTVLASEVVADLLGRKMVQFDGPNATVATTSYAISQMAYPDGVTCEQVLDDLVRLEPGYRYVCGPDTTGGGYSFSWEALPATVRYEVSLEDGGNFPASYQDVWNGVSVRWNHPNGQVQTTTRTLTNTVLDAAGIDRTYSLDLGDEVGTSAEAVQAGDNFLADHAYPTNAGTITVSRPIRDLHTNRMVQPFAIKPGELIRVRGVESYPDALNASSNDGQTVFRIFSKDYNTDGNTATLELDTYSRTIANAVGGLIKKRSRKR